MISDNGHLLRHRCMRFIKQTYLLPIHFNKKVVSLLHVSSENRFTIKIGTLIFMGLTEKLT